MSGFRLHRVVPWLVVLAVGCAAPVSACGPFYNDAHRGLDDPLVVTLEEFYLGLYGGGPGNPLPAHERAVAAEEAERYAEAQVAWREVLAQAGGNRDAFALAREARVHLALLPQVGNGLPPAAFKLYATVHDDDALAQAGGDVLASMLLRQAEARLRTAKTAEGLRLLDQARQVAVSPELRGEIDLLASVAPALAGITAKGVVVDAGAAVARIQRWLDGHPGDQRRAEALGWQAFVIYHQPACVPDGTATVIRIYQTMLDDPTQRSLAAVPAIESLRYLYRELGNPPEWMVANPHHAIAFAWFAVRHGQAPQRKLFDLLRDGVGRADPATVPADVLLSLAQAWASTDDQAMALILARRAYTRGPTPAATYLLARLAASADAPAEAAPLVEALIAAADPQATDALLRLGSAWGHVGRWREALSAYIRADSEPDIEICSDGEIPVDAFVEFMRAPPVLTPLRGSTDWMPRLRARLAVRLARADRITDALAWADDSRRAKLISLQILQEAVASATAAQRPARLHALARFWYDEGRLVVFNEGTWQQWAYSEWWPYTEPKVIPPELIAGRARYQRELEGMTTYHRAHPLFMEVADRFPESPDAPACLYAAALCRYWLCGQTYLHSCEYWLRRARDEGYATQGDALLRRLAETYPQHPLAADPKVVRAVAGGGLPQR